LLFLSIENIGLRCLHGMDGSATEIKL
jgi:hypothetical protein